MTRFNRNTCTQMMRMAIESCPSLLVVSSSVASGEMPGVGFAVSNLQGAKCVSRSSAESQFRHTQTSTTLRHVTQPLSPESREQKNKIDTCTDRRKSK